MNRDQRYYAQVADACSELLVKTLAAPTNGQTVVLGNIIIGGDDESLPPLLREFHARQIAVGTNRVGIAIGDSRVGYGIVWEPSDYNNTNAPWELATYAEGMRKAVFSRKNPK